MAKIAFTTGRITAFKCPPDKKQAFMWDSVQPGLGLRVTPNGKPTFVYQGVFRGKDIRLVIGGVNAWSIPQAQEKAREFKRETDNKRHPLEVTNKKLADELAEKEKQQALELAKRQVDERDSRTFGEAWAVYLAERKPVWGERHYIDHVKLSHVGGVPCKRPKGSVTVAGPLAYFLSLPLKDVTPKVLQAWATKEASHRPARTRLSLRILRVFLSWCEKEEAYKEITYKDAAKDGKVKDATGTAGTRSDSLQREQLSTWFTHVQKIPNPVISAYLQCLLLTGARREELTGLKWDDVNFQWRGMSIKDKVDGIRVVPLTPYVEHLIKGLPRRNEYVFSSVGSASGKLISPDTAHKQVCVAAGLVLTLHGLRRSFSNLCEWIDMPGGISAQIQGHKPQGVREQNYIRRPIDLLRVHHDKIEAWVLEQAQVSFNAGAISGRLSVVAK
jgi:integrase